MVTLVVCNSIGCPDTLRKSLVPEPFGGLFIPNVLAPEGGDDGARLFTPTGVRLIEFEIAIFTGNGQRVWHSTALEEGQPTDSWDGTHNGEPLPRGLYYWQARARFFSGRIWPGMRYGDDASVKEGKFCWCDRARSLFCLNQNLPNFSIFSICAYTPRSRTS